MSADRALIRAVRQVTEFLDAWDHYRPSSIEGNGEVLISWPGARLPALRRSDLRALLDAVEKGSGEPS